MTTPIPAVSDPTAQATAGTSGSASGSSGSGAQGMAGLLDPSTFLNLLVDELKYQNPLSPTSSSEFMSQIAELSQVEQLQSVSSASQLASATGLIGRTVTGTGSSGQLVTGEVTGVTMSTTGPLLDVGGTSVGLGNVHQVTTTPTSTP